MARSRNIKPGFFTNEELVELRFEFRLLFAGLWVIADRRGILEDRPKKIKMQIFPADNVDIDMGLNELFDKKLIVRYSENDINCIKVLNFDKHQNPHRDEKQNDLPDYSECKSLKNNKHCASTVQTLCKHSSAPALNYNPITDSLLPITDSLSSSSLRSEDVVHQEKIPYQEIVNLYQKTLPELPAVLKITDKRKASIKKLWSSDPGINDLDSFGEYFKHIKKIQFLNGQNDRGWTADFDFLVNPTNFLKIIEGKYK